MKYIFDRLILLLIIGGLAYGGMWSFKSYLETKKSIAYKQSERQDKEYLKKFVRLENEIAKLKSQNISKKDIQNVVKHEFDKALVKLIKKNKETISAISVAQVNEKQQVQLNPKIWKHYYNPDNPEAEYYFLKMYKTDESGTKIPWAWVMYFPIKNKWKYGFYPLKIKSKTVITKQKTGGINTYTQLTVENTKDKDSKGKIQKLKISEKDSYVKFVYPPKKYAMQWWNPNLSLGGGIYYNVNDDDVISGMELGLNIFNYGIKELPDYKFVTIGLGSDFNDNNWIFINPLEVNMHKFHIPLIKHLHLVPIKIGYTNHSDWLIGTGLNIEF